MLSCAKFAKLHRWCYSTGLLHVDMKRIHYRLNIYSLKMKYLQMKQKIPPKYIKNKKHQHEHG